MGFLEAKQHLEALGIDAMKTMSPTLHRIEALLEALDNPEKKIPSIHVTGTNGKTSVARIGTALLVAAGLKVGTYTSPHLESMTERIALNGDPITEEAFGDTFDHLAPYLMVVEDRLGEELSYFEVMTAMFFLWAVEAPVEAIVVEVGLGGLWDATNVMDAPVCVITNIGLDHTELLGDRHSIAKEKSGIIKSDSVVVTAERDPEMLAIITSAATDPGDVSVLSRDFDVVENKVALGGRYLSVTARGRSYDGMFLSLHGAHQGINAATAVQAVTSFLPSANLDHSVVAEGLASVSSPGRLETVKTDRPVPTILDVAHNPGGISALVFSLSEAFAFDRVVFVVGILRDKDYKGMIAELTRIPSAIVFTQPRFARSASIETLEAAANELGSPSASAAAVEEALALAYSEAGKRDLLCITGSHYVVGEARGHLLRS